MVKRKRVPFLADAFWGFPGPEMVDPHLSPDDFSILRDFYALHEAFSHAIIAQEGKVFYTAARLAAIMSTQH